MTWQEVAAENYDHLKDIPPEKATRDQFTLYAACVALQGHKGLRGETIHSGPETAAQGENEAAESILTEYMEDELQDAEKYLKLWHETSDKDFKDIAKQELSHFEILAKHARTIDPNIDLNPYMVHHNALLARLV